MKNKSTPVTFLGDALAFPPLSFANDDGLLAVGGDLRPERLLLAYRNGIFPWFNDDALILWWSPDPRMVLYPENLIVSKSMRKVLRDERFTLSCNTDFKAVIEACAKVKRKGQQGTWITKEMVTAYCELNEQGYAVSYEARMDGKLVGGLYGIDLGGVFCGESMFSYVSDASKFAFISMVNILKNKGCRMIDCQMYTPHLEMLGAKEISRDKFINTLKASIS